MDARGIVEPSPDAPGATRRSGAARALAAVAFAATATLGEVVAAETLVRRTAGPEYQASRIQEWFSGRGWRDLWITPIDIPVLDLRTEAGGLTPVKRLGGLQSVILALDGADGRSYSFRSVNKDLRGILPPAYAGTLFGRMIQDQVAAGHPVGNLVVAPLARATGIPTTVPRLAVMPDDPVLGEFRVEFAGMLGTIEEYPTPATEERAGFLGAREIVSTSDLWKRSMEDPVARPDARAYLRARLLDLFVNDGDRHRTQWRWALIDGVAGYQVIPEDRDMAFENFGGVLVGIAGPSKLLPFRGSIPKISAVTHSNTDLDQWLLAGLEKEDFLAEAVDLQSRLGDDVIAASLAAMPGPYHARAGASMATVLRSRRNDLVDAAGRFHRHLAGAVDIHGTDRAEQARLQTLEDGSVELTLSRDHGDGSIGLNLASLEAAGIEDEPSYRRRFVRGETSEIRVYLHGGDDHFQAIGSGPGWLRVHVIGGPGNDQLADTGWHLRFWEVEQNDVIRATSGTHIDRQPYRNPDPVEDSPWREPRNRGHAAKLSPFLTWPLSDNFKLGVGYKLTRYGFRYHPHAQQHHARATYYTGRRAFGLSYGGEFRRPNSRMYFAVDGEFGPSEHWNFFGFGNETTRDRDRDFYRTDQMELSMFPAVAHETAGRLRVRAGPQLVYLPEPGTDGNLLQQLRPYGTGPFVQAGVRAELDWDRRSRLPPVAPGEESWTATDPDRVPTWSGHRVSIGARAYPAVGDVEHPFAGVRGSAVGVVPLGNRLCLASRVAGEKVWGAYPWHESAFLGGRTLRSYQRDRFAGDASILGNLELRARIARSSILMPANFGVMTFADVGRVYLAGEGSDRWHPAAGGGLFIAPVALNLVMQVTVARGDEGMRIHAGSGFWF